MKSKDVREGNNVEYYCNGWGFLELSKEDVFDIEDDINFRPIPLSEKTIVMLGLIRSSNNKERYQIEIEIEQSHINGNRKRILTTNQAGEMIFLDGHWLCRLQYVHEFQNLYHSLSKVDLKMDYSKQVQKLEDLPF